MRAPAWFSTRCRYSLPLAERLLWFSSALSSFPGQVPTQEVNSAAEGNVLACTPHFCEDLLLRDKRETHECRGGAA